jgi:hypothetical protein
VVVINELILYRVIPTPIDQRDGSCFPSRPFEKNSEELSATNVGFV